MFAEPTLLFLLSDGIVLAVRVLDMEEGISNFTAFFMRILFAFLISVIEMAREAKEATTAITRVKTKFTAR